MKKLSNAPILLALSVLVLFVGCTEDDTKKAEVLSVLISNAPVKAVYKLGEQLELAGLEITLEMDNGDLIKLAYEDFSENGITTSPDNGETVTEALTSVTISHTESMKSISQEITINQVVSLGVKTEPNLVSYLSGEILDLSGLIVTLTRDNGDTEDVELESFSSSGLEITPEDGTVISEELTSVTIVHTLSKNTTTQTIEILTISNISIDTPPTQIEYYTGEYLALEGLVIWLNLSNDDSREIFLDDFEEKGVTVSLEEGMELTAEDSEFTITHTESGESVVQELTFLTLTDEEGNTYEHLRIGSQLWMNENLKATKYQNGDDIGTTTPADLDISEEEGAKYQWAFDGDATNAEDFGRLYTKYVAADTRNVCPIGWHVPSRDEFYTLTGYLVDNGHNYDDEETSYQNKLGKAVASKTGWTTQDWEPEAPGYELSTNNSSKFNGLPGGVRSIPDNGFDGMNDQTAWWSSSSDEDDSGYAMGLQYFQVAAAVGAYGDANLGFAIRCLKD